MNFIIFTLGGHRDRQLEWVRNTFVSCFHALEIGIRDTGPEHIKWFICDDVIISPNSNAKKSFCFDRSARFGSNIHSHLRCYRVCCAKQNKSITHDAIYKIVFLSKVSSLCSLHNRVPMCSLIAIAPSHRHPIHTHLQRSRIPQRNAKIELLHYRINLIPIHLTCG